MIPDRADAYTYPVQVTAYGAACNGTHDDTAGITAAIAAAGSGGVVQFPAGVCMVSGNASIAVNDVSLIGSESPHDSDGPDPTEAGTSITIGTASTPPGSSVPFVLGHSVTVRGLNIVYPFTVAHGDGNPRHDAPLFENDGTTGAGNIIFENVHAIAPWIFWLQPDASPQAGTYGNIRFNNTDVYAVYEVFDWRNVQEQVALNNFLSNPSLCGGGGQECSAALKQWTSDNGIWLHIQGTGNATVGRPSVGMAASNLTVVAYRYGVYIDNNGQMDESIFGSTSVWDAVPTVLEVTSTGSITHTVFSGKAQLNVGPAVPLFDLGHPQFPIPGSNNQDHNTLTLNGFTADGPRADFLHLDAAGTGDFGSITLNGVVVRDYCSSPASTNNGVYINAPSAVVVITGSQITTRKGNCGGGLNVTSNPALTAIANNVTGVTPF